MPLRINQLILLLCCTISSSIFAQIQPATSHYMFQPQVANPAFYGTKNGINFGANYRHQWAALNGQPRTINAFADASIPAAHGGVGINLSNDMLGAYNILNINAGYTYIQALPKGIKLNIGLNIGATFSKLDGAKLTTPQGIPGDLNDDILSNQVQKSTRPSITIGLALTHKFLEFGIAYTNAIQSKDKFKGENKTEALRYGATLQTYISSKIKIKADFFIRPSILLATDFKELQTEISVLGGYKNYITLGFNVRGYNKKAFESLSPIIGVGPLKNICIYYSYDVSLSHLKSVNKGSHEISLNYLLPNNKIYKNPKMINNPRFL
ncbi:MAG TPA: PorP/SprF family type IX secretion system membrane protein [Chitinophagales bacterium]|nr:PorP/SprF family type IX secretion system membrane protein [Chitinophagales bacterium]